MEDPKSFAGKNKENYIKYLKGETEWRNEFYIDPDGLYIDNKEGSYHYELCHYLKCFDKGFEYHISKASSNREDGEKGYSIPPAIQVLYGNDVIFLRSDQFGFSAPQPNRGRGDKYPYDRYLRIAKDKNEAAEFVADVIWKTRTIGGSFLWPIKQYYTSKGVNWKSQYNFSRGANSYIHDRIDFTLLEIKHALDGEYEKGKHKRDVLYKQYINEDTKIRSWLQHFKSFPNYVEKMKFTPFVDIDNGYQPFNLFSNKSIPVDEPDDYFIKENKLFISSDERGLRDMLCNLRDKILERSNSILKDL